MGIFIFCTVVAPIGGCKSMDAWMGSLEVTKDGEVKGALKGAGEGGTFNENTGLNLGVTTGDNSLVALAIALVAIMLPFMYPIQRALRKRQEAKLVKELETGEKLRRVANGAGKGAAVLALLVLSSCVAAQPKKAIFSDSADGIIDFDRRVYTACRHAIHDERMAAMREYEAANVQPRQMEPVGD